MKNRQTLIPVEQIEDLIFFVRGRKVMLDADLARIYGVSTKAFNQAVRRNRDRFPADFVFQMTSQEAARLRSQKAVLNRSQIVTGSQKHRDPRYLPYLFTEHGAIMAANVLNSERAVALSVYVVRAFSKMREVLAGSKELAKKLSELERKLSARLEVHEEAIVRLFSEIRALLNPPAPRPEPKKRRIGFHQQ